MSAGGEHSSGAARAVGEVVVVGYGPAARRLVERLDAYGFRGPVTVLGAEPVPAYHRPLLTSVLDGTLTPAAIRMPPPPGSPRVRLGVTAVRIDRHARRVYADDGSVHPYDTLVLATGARPDIPDLRGATAGPGGSVRTLRFLEDTAPLPDGPVGVLGGGVLGVEAALALRRRGHAVALVHPHPYPMNRQLDERAGAMLADCLARRSVSLHLGRRAVEYVPGKLLLDNGHLLTAETLFVCTGVTPETRLARQAGLSTRRGVLVDRHLRTEDARIHAIGDCAECQGQAPGLVTHAWEQAEALARLLSGGRLPRQGSSRTVVRLRGAGLDLAVVGDPGAPGEESVRLSDPARGRYAALTLSGGRITGGVLLGLPRAIAAVSQLYDRGLPVPAGRLALLLGTAPATDDVPVELPRDAVICFCNNVRREALERAWHDGARDLPALAAATRATSGCGSCAADVRHLCRALAAAPAAAGAGRGP